MISDSTLAIMFFWFFVLAAVCATYWQLRAEHWKTLFETTSKATFERFAKEYIDQMPIDELCRCLPREWVEGRVIAGLMVEEWKRMEKKP